jgi:hypothetical protein
MIGNDDSEALEGGTLRKKPDSTPNRRGLEQRRDSILRKACGRYPD